VAQNARVLYCNKIEAISSLLVQSATAQQRSFCDLNGEKTIKAPSGYITTII
jgi:hypothetical protein